MSLVCSLNFGQKNYLVHVIALRRDMCRAKDNIIFFAKTVCDLVTVLAIKMWLVCSLNCGQNNYLVHVIVKLQEMAQYQFIKLTFPLGTLHTGFRYLKPNGNKTATRYQYSPVVVFWSKSKLLCHCKDIECITDDQRRNTSPKFEENLK